MRPATLKDVAALAKVGISTASYVLNETGLHKVSPETQERIRKAAAELRYRPNSVARELKSGQCRLIALLLPGVNYSFMPELLQGIEEVLCDNHYNALLSTYRTDEEFHASCRLLSQQRIAGGICNPGGIMQRQEELESYFPDMPWVICSSMSNGHYPAVWVPAGEVGRIGLEYLLQKNHRRIACFIQGNNRWNELAALEKKYCFDANETIIWLQSNPYDIKLIWEELSYIKKTPPEKFPTAIFFNGDLEAAEFTSQAPQHNMRIPQDISVMGVNGSALCNLVSPQLCSVNQPRIEQGRLAAMQLLNWIKTNQRPETLDLTANILEGSSVLPLPCPTEN